MEPGDQAEDEAEGAVELGRVAQRVGHHVPAEELQQPARRRADRIAPIRSSRQVTRPAVAVRSPSQNRPTLSSSETATTRTLPPAPRTVWPLQEPMPESAVVTNTPSPRTAISAKLRSQETGKPGRSRRGTSQTWFIAFCIAFATPRAPKNVSTARREADAAAPERMDVRAQLGADHRELAQRRVQHVLLQVRVAGEHHAEHRDQHEQQREGGEERVIGTSAARLPAWSSLNLRHTATGNARARWRCWNLSRAARERRMALLVPALKG